MTSGRAFTAPVLALLWGSLLLGASVRTVAAERTVGIAVSPGLSAYTQAADAAAEQLATTSRVERVDLQPGSNKKAIERLLARGPSVVVVVGAKAVDELRKIDSEIPLVYAMVMDPAAIDLPVPGDPSSSLETGVSMSVSLEAHFAMIRAMVPEGRRIGVLYDPENSALLIKRARIVAEQFDFELVGQVVRSGGEVLGATRLLTARVDAMWSIHDTTVFSGSNATMLVLQCLRARLPFFGISKPYVTKGALASVVASPAAVGRRAAEMATIIANNDGHVSIPPEAPSAMTFFFNRSTAKRLEIDLPSEILGQALQEASP